jgi:hypothetical protein
VTTNFLYDGTNLAQELSGSTPTANFLTGLRIDETFTRTDAGGTSTLLIIGILELLMETRTAGTQTSPCLISRRKRARAINNYKR